MHNALHIFNPDNDLALAAGTAGYVPPPFATQMSRDLAVLPAWLARPGDCVLVHDEQSRQWLRDGGLGVQGVLPSQLVGLPVACVRPWGWSKALCHRLLKLGINPKLLPGGQALERMRQLSHRRMSKVLLEGLRQELGAPIGIMPVEIGSQDELRAVARQWGTCYVKAPWSGSGQGVMQVRDADEPRLLQWAGGVLRRQGALLCEPQLRRVAEFGVELQCDGSGGVELLGCSAFSVDAHHQWQFCLVEPQAQVMARIAESYARIEDVLAALLRVVSREIACDYAGTVGIDMMLHRDDAGNIALQPCVELNLRCTMGAVAVALAGHGLQGRFAIVRGEVPAGAKLLTPRGNLFTAVLLP